MNSMAIPGKLRPRFMCHVGNPQILKILPGLTNSATLPPDTAGAWETATLGPARPACRLRTRAYGSELRADSGPPAGGTPREAQPSEGRWQPAPGHSALTVRAPSAERKST